jgi:glycosyltransferase involved in cell wall biosynthesis
MKDNEKKMKLLTVTTGNIMPISAFITDHVEKLNNRNFEVEYFLVEGKGISGYLKNIFPLMKKIRESKPDLIHAHYGLCGLLSSLQFKVPVVTTFHGSDINQGKTRIYSKIAHMLSNSSIFVARDLAEKIGAKDYYYIPCGVDFDIFKPENKEKARKTLNLSSEKKYILFSSSFSIPVKNYSLAREALSFVKEKDVEILELKGYSRKEVANLLNAVDLALLTSISEGSPQFIKEAMACNTPIVSTKVGDVSVLLNNIEGCFICEMDAKSVGKAIDAALSFNMKTNSRSKISHLDANVITHEIIDVYKKTKKKK